MPARPFFVHVSKCSGTALMAAVAREYGPDRVFRIYGDTAARLATLRALPPAERDRLAAFGGHVEFGLEAVVGTPLTCFTMLRDPVARIASHYAWVQRHRDEPGPAGMLVGVHSLTEYVVRSPAAAMFNNAMVRLLGGDVLRPDRPADDAMLELALARVRDGRVLVGLQERYAESLALFARELGWSRVTVAPANVAPAPPTAGLDPDTIALITRHNELDRILLATAREVFADRAAAADGLDADVARLRRRSRRVAARARAGLLTGRLRRRLRLSG